eukprot:TRINITY_DN1433_c0_g1_i1.p1 TRINITY_DN1433_c0_g1~~TRINITY_DN1433_c0_g1_i1.p1  ORF type:complete len:213 (-),score=80.11 TRINITY_DN1433_c0_g1_i1:160-798(-)
MCIRDRYQRRVRGISSNLATVTLWCINLFLLLLTNMAFKVSDDDPRIVELEFKTDFTPKELEQYRATFVKYDKNKSNGLELFELNVMYEEWGQPKTNLELRQLIAEANTSGTGAISYREFLAIILKDKKGIAKGPWSGFAAAVGKVHDNSKETGRKANFFEQEAAKQRGDPLEEEKKRIAAEEKKKAEAEKKRKEKVAAGLAKLKAGINQNM